MFPSQYFQLYGSMLQHTSAVNITQEYMQVNCVVMRDGTGDGLGTVEIPFPNLQINIAMDVEFTFSFF